MMRRVLLSLALLLMVLCPWLTVAGASPCTAYLSPPGPLPSALPAGTLCLHGGVYPQTQLQLTANLAATLMSAPGEHAILQATLAGGLWVRSPNITLADLIIDNGGYANAALTVNTAADHFTLKGSEVRHGSYYGIDVWGSYVTLAGNTVHGFQPDDQRIGNDTQCHNIHPGASFGVLTSSTVYDCWGDGVQFYGVLPTPITQTVSVYWTISGNKFYRGTLGYSENAIDIKQAGTLIIQGNDIGGYNNAGRLGTGQPAVVFHGNVTDVRFAANRVHDSFEGLQLSNGRWITLTVSGNEFRNLTHYTLAMSAARGAVVRGNTIVSGGAEVIQVASTGWQGGSFDHNVIQASGLPRLYSGATWAGVSVGPNAWVSATAGFLASAGDVFTAGAGFGVPAPRPSATATASATSTPTSTPSATASPSATATATQTASPTPTDTPTPTETATPTVTAVPTLSGCWNLRGKTPISIPCP